MAVKAKCIVLIAITVIVALAMMVNISHAALSTTHTIHLTLVVVGALSMDLEDSWLNEGLADPKAEAFSELRENGMRIDRLEKNHAVVWLFTKTE